MHAVGRGQEEDWLNTEKKLVFARLNHSFCKRLSWVAIGKAVRTTVCLGLDVLRLLIVNVIFGRAFLEACHQALPIGDLELWKKRNLN